MLERRASSAIEAATRRSCCLTRADGNCWRSNGRFADRRGDPLHDDLWTQEALRRNGTRGREGSQGSTTPEVTRTHVRRSSPNEQVHASSWWPTPKRICEAALRAAIVAVSQLPIPSVTRSDRAACRQGSEAAGSLRTLTVSIAVGALLRGGRRLQQSSMRASDEVRICRGVDSRRCLCLEKQSAVTVDFTVRQAIDDE